MAPGEIRARVSNRSTPVSTSRARPSGKRALHVEATGISDRSGLGESAHLLCIVVRSFTSTWLVQREQQQRNNP
jgi:hypothetical protein